MAVYDLDRIAVPDAPPGYADDVGDLHYVPAPCQVACPIGTDAPSYIAYIWEERYEEAFEAITATNPLSSICGRVCDAPCEPACRRVASDGALQIRNLKRFVMDEVGHRYDPPPVPVTRSESIGIVGAGPAGLTAAHDLCMAGFAVHLYEMTDRPGGMIAWGIPAFRLPPGAIEEDIDRLTRRCPGLEIHCNTALGRDVTLAGLEARHDAVLLAIGAWWGRPMGIPGEDHPGVVDGVGFLRRVNAGERPELPETVVVVGGGDVAMDACRVARRLPGCRRVEVIYRRGPEEIPARRIELEGAIKEGVEFVYHLQPVAVEARGDGLILKCVETTPGEPGDDGRRQPVAVPGSEQEIPCGMVIAAVGQRGECEELANLDMMRSDRVRADFGRMVTGNPRVFAAGDGAFGGSTIVMAMHHGQRAAYYMKAFLDGIESPIPYRTPFRTRRVPVAQDLDWEKLPVHEPPFHGLGSIPVRFPEIESTYDGATAHREAARCFRCDAETGSTDYSVRHREDIFSMARTGPDDAVKHRAMLAKRLRPRDDPFPEGRPATLDDLTFLPANLSRLVIDPYREACQVSTDIGGRLDLEHPFLVGGLDAAPAEVRRDVASDLAASGGVHIGRRRLARSVRWLQLVRPGRDEPAREAAGIIRIVGAGGDIPPVERLGPDQVVGLAVSSPARIEAAVTAALDAGLDLLLLDGTGGIAARWPELAGPPDLTLLRDAVVCLRRLGREEAIDLVHFGGVRSGTDAAKLIALGAKAVVLGIPVALAAGGHVAGAGELEFTSDLTERERADAVGNIIRASVGEASIMARCTGKTKLHNLEPEDLRSITLATAEATGIPLAGCRLAPESA